MNKQKGFLLRLPEEERQLAKQLASDLGCSENRLYNDLIHDGLLMREQMQYMAKLRKLQQRVSQKRVLELLDRVPDVEPIPADIAVFNSDAICL
ncbi:MAG: hypothetical protein WCL34_11575 [Methylococcaceae bacterium]|jgi:hypothetical protein